MANPSVVIDIAAEYTGKKAFKQADTATQKLTKNVKSLAGALGLAFGTAAVVRFGKASVKAFAEDQKSATALTQTLKNLSLSFANTGIEDFITKMSLATGVADDQLRPAFQKLVQTNLDVAKSQKLVALALDISAAGFGDVVSVSNTLAQAMVGNVKGLKQFNLGLTQAELSAMSFDELLEKLTKTFKGQAAAAADTYAGKLDIIKNAAGEAQESIGKGLIDALMKIGNNKDIQGLTDDILAAGEGIGYLISGIGDLIKTIGSVPGFGFEGVGKNAPMPFTLNPLAILAQKAYTDQLSAQYKLEEKRYKIARENNWLLSDPTPTKDSILTREEAIAGMTPAQKRKEIADKKAAADAAKARAAELARIKALAALKTKTDKIAAAKDLATKKAAAVFDINRIQIAAALKATYDKDERLRLLALQEIENDNGETALKYIDQLKLLTQEQQTNKLAGIKTISETELNYINQLLLDELQRIKTTKMSEDEAAAARQAAYAKYNAAIQQSGGLAEANFYTEKTQVELLSIAKLAALDQVAAAQATMDILNYTTQVDIIARIAAAQKLADDAKMAALKSYLALLAQPVVMPTPVVPPTVMPPGFGGGGQPIAPGYGGFFDYMPPVGTGSTGSSNSSVTVIVEGNVLDGDDFTEKVNDALLNANRTGLSRFPAGFLVDNG